MLFGQDRAELRRMYADAWRKAQESAPLSPLEAHIADVVAEHPEYQRLLDGEALDYEYNGEEEATNPFLHMGLHLALREQVATDRPPGIRALWQRIVSRIGDGHEAEHRMGACLAEALWEAQRSGSAPDEAAYLDALRRLT